MKTEPTYIFWIDPKGSMDWHCRLMPSREEAVALARTYKELEVTAVVVLNAGDHIFDWVSNCERRATFHED